METFNVFISYAREDASFAHRLTLHLREAGFSIFLDEASLAAGDSFALELSRAIHEARFVLVLLSPSYISSRWALQELKLALTEELRLRIGEIKVIPLLLNDCEIPLLIRDKTYLDFRDSSLFSSKVKRLIHDLKTLSTPLNEKIESEKEGELSGQRPERLDSDTAAELLAKLSDAVQAFVSPTNPKKQRTTQTSSAATNQCFIVMPFGLENLEIVYEDFVKPTLEHCGLSCERGDDLFGSNVIMDDIRSSIANARLVIADLTGKNANVFYEVGIAHTMDKPVLLLAQSMDDVPFDLRHRRVLIYEYSPRGCKRLESVLPEHVKNMLTKGE